MPYASSKYIDVSFNVCADLRSMVDPSHRPNCIRVNPILHWDYTQVWLYLREAELAAEAGSGQGSSCCSSSSKCGGGGGGEAGASVGAADDATGATPAAVGSAVGEVALNSRPYCKLYDDGYTSLGSTKDTIPNPNLRRADGTFQPAYALTDGESERGGRISKKKKKNGDGEIRGSGEGGGGGGGNVGGASEISVWMKNVSILCCGIAVGLAYAKHHP